MMLRQSVSAAHGRTLARGQGAAESHARVVRATARLPFEMPEIPNYRHVLARVALDMRQDLHAMQLYRVRMAYPVFGFQFVISLHLPAGPAPIE